MTDSASFDLIPRKRIPNGIRLPDTMFAEAETLRDDRRFRNASKARSLCLVPLQSYFELDHRGSIRWRVGERSGRLHADLVAMVAISADAPPCIKQPLPVAASKRALAIIPADQSEAWLSCQSTTDARTFLRSYPADVMRADAQPLRSRAASTRNAMAMP